MALGRVTRGISRRWKMKIQITAAVQSPLRRQPVFLWYLLTWIYSWEMEELTNVKILGLKGLRICPWNMINALEVNPALWVSSSDSANLPCILCFWTTMNKKASIWKILHGQGNPISTHAVINWHPFSWTGLLAVPLHTVFQKMKFSKLRHGT